MHPKYPKRKLDMLEQRFELDEAFLSSPNTAALQSAVIRVTDRRTGDLVVLKFWENVTSSRMATATALIRSGKTSTP